MPEVGELWTKKWQHEGTVAPWSMELEIPQHRLSLPLQYRNWFQRFQLLDDAGGD
jgi:hypothetical protein